MVQKKKNTEKNTASTTLVVLTFSEGCAHQRVRVHKSSGNLLTIPIGSRNPPEYFILIDNNACFRQRVLAVYFFYRRIRRRVSPLRTFKRGEKTHGQFNKQFGRFMYYNRRTTPFLVGEILRRGQIEIFGDVYTQTIRATLATIRLYDNPDVVSSLANARTNVAKNVIVLFMDKPEVWRVCLFEQ